MRAGRSTLHAAKSAPVDYGIFFSRLLKRFPNWTLEDIARLTDAQIHFLVFDGKAVRRTFSSVEEARAAMKAEKELK